ncbi:esterase-like activity of phytase family protein [Williamsia sterculiae]|uniref:Uncharacterized conserved protein n=1 Tax=Williamsia sterculiae TaxID=1344003 RepID=A0A1N7CDU7_9NOCA|nr:esterase-like activity of phytase family protein [Williamsia sterculiae]SIR61637.1 Uncharacterized conserved protein [Williamsia sterculiae]
MRMKRLSALVMAGLGALSVSSAVAVSAPADAAIKAKFMQSVTLPDDMIPWPLRFGGISGIDNVGGGNFVLISDGSGDVGPARYYQLHLPFLREGILGGPVGPLQLTGGGTVLGPGNMPLAPGQFDLEGIRKRGGDLVVSSEGAHPFIRIIRPPGLFVRDLPLPVAYRPGRKTGLQVNAGLEGLAVSPNGTISTLTEGPLQQDPAGGSRLLQFVGKGTAEYVYRTDPGYGASELLAINNTDFLVLERSYDAKTRRNGVKIYWTTTNGGARITGATSGATRALPKNLIYDVGALPNLVPDNVEGMTWGPNINKNKRTLVLVSDDNFNHPAQHTKIHILSVAF